MTMIDGDLNDDDHAQWRDNSRRIITKLIIYGGKDAFVDFETKRLLQADHLGHFVQQRSSNESLESSEVMVNSLSSRF